MNSLNYKLLYLSTVISTPGFSRTLLQSDSEIINFRKLVELESLLGLSVLLIYFLIKVITIIELTNSCNLINLKSEKNKLWLLFLPIINLLFIFKLTKNIDLSISDIRNKNFNIYRTIWKIKLFNSIVLGLFTMLLYLSLFHNKNISPEFGFFLLLVTIGFLIRIFTGLRFILELHKINSELILSLKNNSHNEPN